MVCARARGLGGNYAPGASSTVLCPCAGRWDQEPDVLEPPVEGDGKVTGLLHCPLASGMGGDAAEVHPAGAMRDEHQDIESFRQHSAPCKKSTARIPPAWHAETAARPGPRGGGAGSMPAACRISQMVEVATAMPSLSTSPWIRRWPRSGFSRPAQHESLDTQGGRRTAGAAPPARVVILRGQPPVPGQERRGHMIGDHHGRSAGRATLLVRAVDAILGTHSRAARYPYAGSHRLTC